MGFEHYIETAFKGVLTNPLISLLREIRMGRILQRSLFPTSPKSTTPQSR